MVRPGLRLLAMNSTRLQEKEKKGIEYKGKLKPLTEEESRFVEEHNLLKEEIKDV